MFVTVRTLVSEPLGISDGIYMGDIAERDLGSDRIATIESSMFKDAATRNQATADADDDGDDGDPDNDDTDDTAANEDDADSNGSGSAARKSRKGAGFLHMMAQAIQDEDPQEGKNDFRFDG